MRIFLTGGTGFIGSATAQQLRGRGDDVAALVRTPGKASALGAMGCELVEGSLDDRDAIAEGMTECDAVIHAAGVYEVGVMPERRDVLFEGNVTGTDRVLAAAEEAKVSRVVYVSTFGATGDTRGDIHDETVEHHGEHLSAYDESKHRAHEVAQRYIAGGLPVVIVMPTQVYGPGDNSDLGVALDMYLKRRMPAMAFPDTGLSMVYRDDVAAGTVAALDRGRLGESYILSGENVRARQVYETLANLVGRRPPRVSIPTWAIRAMKPLAPRMGRLIGLPPNVDELISTADGVTFWASHDKATRELDYQPRSLEQGLRDMLREQGRLP